MQGNMQGTSAGGAQHCVSSHLSGLWCIASPAIKPLFSQVVIYLIHMFNLSLRPVYQLDAPSNKALWPGGHELRL